MRKFFITISAAVSFLFLLSFSASGSAEQNNNTNRFADFEFEEYFAIISVMAETEEYPHYLAENAERYEQYKSNNPNLPFDIVIAYVNVNMDKEPYIDILPVANPDDITVLVNKFFALPQDWEPDDFVDIGTGHLMREEAAEQFVKMREAMRDDNLNLNPVVTYRSFTRQRNHYNNAAAAYGSTTADGGFARPGHSEHQTGLAIDVLHRGHDGGLMMNMGFENSNQYKWMLENAHKFGFILRYPNGYRQQSGFMFEPWHWRYVGIPVATAMFDEGIALYEEFYGRYLMSGVVDKVNTYIIEQQALAEAAEAAAIAEAEAEAAAAEAALAEEMAAAEAAAAAEEAAIAEAELAAETAARAATEAEALAAAEAEEEARRLEAMSGNRYFLEGFSTLFIAVLAAVLLYTKKKRRKVNHDG